MVMKLRHFGLFALGSLVLFPLNVGAADFAGKWAVNGTMVGRVNASVAPVCSFRQSGNALSGSCKGPNGLGSADGAVDGGQVVWEWHIVATDSIGLSGIARFHGALGSDGVIRGTWTHSSIIGESGRFTAQKV